MTDYTVTRAALFLREQRGITAKRDTVKRWCQRGLFPSARLVADDFEQVHWMIPESDLIALVPPPQGRPPQQRKDTEMTTQITSAMTWNEVVAALNAQDLSWNDQVRAVAGAFNAADDEPFIDWLINGHVSGDETMDAVFEDWREE